MQNIQLPSRTLALDGFSAGFLPARSTIDSGMIFLEGELEKRDDRLREPLASVTWPRDIPVRTGGGFVENVASFAVNYATSGGATSGVHGRETSNVPVMQADIARDSFRVFTWSHVLKVPIVEQEMMLKIGRSLDDILDRGIHLAHDKQIEQSVYTGLSAFGTTGLVNNAKVAVDTAAPHTSGGTDTQWSKKTAAEIIKDINAAVNATWAACDYDVSGMANHILLPPAQFALLRSTAVSANGERSIYAYLMENNIAAEQGVSLSIHPCRWCVGAGADGADRMVCYCNNEDRVRFDITVPLHRVMTQPSAADLAYMTPYMSQFSEVQWLFTEHARYVDGI